MSDIRKDMIEIDAILNAVSDYGDFAKCKEPEYLTEKCLYEQACQRLAVQQLVCKNCEAVAQFHFAKMISMVKNKPLDKDEIERIQEQIAVFEENLRKGNYNVNS